MNTLPRPKTRPLGVWLPLLLATSVAPWAGPYRNSALSSVDPDGIRSLLGNPAGLPLLGGHELALQLTGSEALGQSAVLVGGPHLGLGWESLPTRGSESTSRFLAGTGIARKGLSAGLLAVRPLEDSPLPAGCAATSPCADASRSPVWSFDLGVLWRPSRFVSLGWTSPDLFDRDPWREHANTVGVALRPLGTPALSVSVESFLSRRPWHDKAWDDPSWELGAKIRPTPWLELEGRLDPEHPQAYGFGMRLQLSPATSFYSSAASHNEDIKVQTVGVRFAQKTRPAVPTADGVMIYHLGNPASEAPSGPFWKRQQGFWSLREDFREMGARPDLRTVVLDLGSHRLSPARAGVLRRLVLDLRSRGKQVYAWSNDLDMSSLRVLAAADRAAISPDGTVRARGLAMDVLYFGKLLRRVGVEVQVVKTGPWKAAMEPFEKDSMSEPARENLSRILLDLDSMTLADAAAARRIDPAALRAYVDTGSLLPTSARKLGLVDTLLDRDSLGRWAKGRKLSAPPPPAQREAWGTPRRIAVVVLEGQIVDKPGETGMVPWNTSLVAQTVAARLESLRRDPSVSAVVLRIQSPGGSVTGSERLRRAVERLAKDKPVVASLGHTAASGGYMAALGATRIFSEPEALVGSIGVFAAKPSIAGLLDSVGVKVERVRTAPHAGASSPYARLDSLEMARMTEYIEDAHRQFDSEVMRARNMDTTALHRVDGGRVFSGVQALRLGLVDTLGGLEEAVGWARSRAKGRTETEPVWFDARTSRWLEEGSTAMAALATQAAGPLSEKAALWQAWKGRAGQGIWAQSPWEPSWE